MSTVQLADGTLCRQLLPHGFIGTGRATDIRNYRWVTWDTEPIPRAQAKFHLYTGGPAACVVVCFRGPKGGWTDASFVRHIGSLPREYVRVSSWSGQITTRTYYYGWVQERVAPNVNLPVPLPKDAFGERYRAHLTLHA